MRVSTPPALSYRLLRLVFILVGLAALGGFGVTFADFLKNKDVYLARFDLAGFEKGLRSETPVRARGHLGDWQQDYSLLHKLNVTGEVKSEIADSGTNKPPPPPPVVGESDVEVTYIQYVRDSAPQNCAFIGPRNLVQRPDEKTAGDLYCTGDQFELDAKPGVKIRVVAIHSDSVDFDVPGSELSFTVKPGVYEVNSGQILANSAGLVNSTFVAANTRMTGSNHWELGTDDFAEISSMNEDELLAGFQVRPQRDSKTGKVRGLQINRIKEDSVLSRQGLKEKDIILDIDGFPATDRSSLIQYLRKNPERDSVTVRLERAGAVRSYTYKVPGR